MNMPVVLNAEAEADLDEAAQWYEKRLPGLGVDLVTRVRETLTRIASVHRFPYGCSISSMRIGSRLLRSCTTGENLQRGRIAFLKKPY
jgi:hypothetical protein